MSNTKPIDIKQSLTKLLDTATKQQTVDLKAVERAKKIIQATKQAAKTQTK